MLIAMLEDDPRMACTVGKCSPPELFTLAQLLVAQYFRSVWNVLVFPGKDFGREGRFSGTVWGYSQHHRHCQFSKKNIYDLHYSKPYVNLSVTLPLGVRSPPFASYPLWCGHPSELNLLRICICLIPTKAEHFLWFFSLSV